MDKDSALAIINEYKAAFEDGTVVPATEEERISYAKYLHSEAKKTFEAGMKGMDVKAKNAIQSMIFIGDSALKAAPPKPDDSKQSVTVPATKIEHTYPRRSSGGLSEGDEREIENLPIPHEIEGDPEAMPRDLSLVSDRDIRRLSGEYNAYLARVTYLLGVEAADLQAAQHLLNAAEAKALREIKITDPETKKPKLAKVMDAEIAAVPDVVEWSDKVSKHQERVTRLKSLKEIYSGNVERLSRDWTMRQNEWEKGR